jgi:hypothetical protein
MYLFIYFIIYYLKNMFLFQYNVSSSITSSSKWSFHSLVCWWGFFFFFFLLFCVAYLCSLFLEEFLFLRVSREGGWGRERRRREERSVSKGGLAMAAMAAEKAPAMAVALQQQQQQQPGVASAAVTGDDASALTREQMLRERYLKGVKKRKCTMCGNTARARSFFLFSFFLGAPLRTLNQTLYSPSQISKNKSGAMQFRGFKQSI